MVIIHLDQVRRRTIDKHHLGPETQIDDIPRIAEDLCGLHATCPTTPYLSLWARTKQFQRNNLDHVLYEEHLLGKVRCWRKTVYILPKTMIPWAMRLLQPAFEVMSRKYLEFRGIEWKEFEILSQKVMESLQNRELDLAEIKKEVHSSLNISAIVNLLCDQFRLIRSQSKTGWRDNRHQYQLFRDYFPDLEIQEIPFDSALRNLLKAYIHTYGPVTDVDMTWWVGLTKRQVRLSLASLQDELREVTIAEIPGRFFIDRADEALFSETPPPHEEVVNFLPTLDPYVMGYKERNRYINITQYPYVFDKSGNAAATILVNGVIVGVWDFLEEESLIKFHLREKVGREIHQVIEEKAHAVGAFIADQEIHVKECPTMVPLTKRTAGSMMSPLKGSQ